MFNEENTIDQMIVETLCGKSRADRVASLRPAYNEVNKWNYIPANMLKRQYTDIMVEDILRKALLRINPEISAQPDRADEVIYRLRTIPMTVQSTGLVRANEQFNEWLKGEKTMPFGKKGEHVPVHLIDFENPANNDFTCTQQWIYPTPNGGKRFDIVLLVNGIPLVIGESKTPVRKSVTWIDGAYDIHSYEETVPQMFVPNVFSFATEGKQFRYGTIGMPIEIWGPWHDTLDKSEGTLEDVIRSIRSILQPKVLLDLLQNFTIYATDKKHRRIKIISRYQQYEGANMIVQRVLRGRPKKGLLWHFQGSGKSLLMVFAAQKLRMHPTLENPTVMIVVDRIDLDTQITATFNACDIPNMIRADTREELHNLLAQDIRKIIITTIYKFAEAGGILNDRSNIIAMVDEAHRTQEGDLGRCMREALPNAFLFGLTGTPINKRDRNTFWTFGADEDKQGYMSRYSFQDSIRDKATLPLHFEAVDVQLHIDKEAINEEFNILTDTFDEQDRDELAKKAAKIAVLIKAPERVQAICNHIVNHYKTKVEPNGFKAQIVTYDRECCDLYKKELDKLEGPEVSAIVMHAKGGKNDEFKEWKLSKDSEEKLLDRFRDQKDPLKFIIVTSKLLTGFDAPILQVMYLDKPMKDHSLLQAICRTNRPYPQKDYGLIVDYLGIFDNVARALDFDEEAIHTVITNIDDLKSRFQEQMNKCLVFFPGVDRKVGGFEGLSEAQQHLPNNDVRDDFAAEYSILTRMWEAISPDSFLTPFKEDYKWLTQVYESIKPPSGHGIILWHALGAKTIDLIHRNVNLEVVRDNLETLVMNTEILENLIQKFPPQKIKKIEIDVGRRIGKHKNNPIFIALGERLIKLKEKHEQGLIISIEFLKKLLAIARELVQAEKQIETVDEQAQAKTALKDLFAEIKNKNTPIVVERIVNEIDEIVRKVRFEGWQVTSKGQREVKLELRKVLYVKYQLKEQDLFDKAYNYIEQYY